MLYDLIVIEVFWGLYVFNILIFREMDNTIGHVKFKNHYEKVHVQLSGSCKMWRSEVTSEDGGWLSTDVYVDIIEQKWHANLKVVNLFVPVKYIMNSRWS